MFAYHKFAIYTGAKRTSILPRLLRFYTTLDISIDDVPTCKKPRKNINVLYIFANKIIELMTINGIGRCPFISIANINLIKYSYMKASVLKSPTNV